MNHTSIDLHSSVQVSTHFSLVPLASATIYGGGQGSSKSHEYGIEYWGVRDNAVIHTSKLVH